MNIIQIIKEEIKYWYHGTPDAREIKSVGGFSERTGISQYITDPDKYSELQLKIIKAKKEGDNDLYINLLRQSNTLIKDLIYKKPIYFTGNKKVASTYANPWRVFDYVNAEPSIIKVKIDDSGKVLTIPAYGESFKGIDINIVKDALLKDGVNEKTIDDYFKKFQLWINDKGKMSSETLGIIAQLLGYDIVDILGIRDVYAGKGVPSTIRMVFDPKRIKII